MPRIFIMLGLLCSLIGCSQVRPAPPAGYAVPVYKILPSKLDPGGLSEVSADAPKPLADDLLELLGRGRSGGFGGGNSKVLLLSGGSQHGAFGAGLFKGMAQVPDYDVVTGISTGSLQSTFVFLANRPVPADRVYPEHMKVQPDFGQPGQSNVMDLALAYRITNENNLMDVGKLGLAGAAFKGAAANFKPLRAALDGLISPGTLRAVAAEADNNRILLAGIADLDDGYGYAVDLTRIARDATEAFDAGDVAKGTAARHAYIEAMIASSSVPPGVPPVSLTFQVITRGGLATPQTDMFIDGGARYGVFYGQLHDTIASDQATDMDLIVNGFLYGKQWTTKDGGRIEEWNAITVALRAVDLMENQVYRLSIGDAERWAVERGTLRMAFISNEELQVVTTKPLEWPYRGKTCQDWKIEDGKKLKPMEFYPNYMKCIVDYGIARGQRDPWNKVVGPTAE